MNLGLVFTIQNCPLEVKKESIQNVVPCSLRKTVVSLDIPENLKNKNIIKIIPDKALVNKCDGSCWMTQNTCKATLLKNTSLAVTGILLLFILYWDLKQVCTCADISMYLLTYLIFDSVNFE